LNAQRPEAADRKLRRGDFDLEERLLDYAATIVRLVESMTRSDAARHIGGQMLRSGTSPLLNHGEAQAAESRADFVHKMSICLKELRETRRSLRLTQRVPLVADPKAVDPLLRETEELIRIFYSSLKTARLAREDSDER
jgi:four helix bundle protein